MTLDNLLQEFSGLLSRMRERDGNENLDNVCKKMFVEDLTNTD